MRFVIGPIPEEIDFTPLESGWHRQKELNYVLSLTLSVPVALLTGLLAMWLYSSLLNSNGLEINVDAIYISVVVLIPIHEVVHAIATPNWGLSQKTVIGFWPQRVLPYAAYLGVWTRKQALWCVMAPLVVLSSIPMLLMFMVKLDNPLLYHFFAVNAMASCGDLLTAIQILREIPPRAVMKNKGWSTYWRETLQPS